VRYCGGEPFRFADAKSLTEFSGGLGATEGGCQ